MGVDKNIIEKSGAWFSYSGTRIGQGRENVKQFLHDHPEMALEIETKVRQAAGLPAAGPTAQEGAPAAKEKDIASPVEKPGKASKGK
jgi:recombination protein RecA